MKFSGLKRITGWFARPGWCWCHQDDRGRPVECDGHAVRRAARLSRWGAR